MTGGGGDRPQHELRNRCTANQRMVVALASLELVRFGSMPCSGSRRREEAALSAAKYNKSDGQNESSMGEARRDLGMVPTLHTYIHTSYVWIESSYENAIHVVPGDVPRFARTHTAPSFATKVVSVIGRTQTAWPAIVVVAWGAGPRPAKRGDRAGSTRTTG